MATITLPVPGEMSESMKSSVTLTLDGLDYLHGTLDKYGFAIVTGLLSEDEVETGLSLFWDYLESLGTGIERGNPTTQTNDKWPPTFSTGILDNPSLSAGQSSVAWWGRLKAKSIFSALYGTDDLVTSLDAIGLFRESIKTKNSLWYHTDANPTKHIYNYSTQGILNLVDTTRDGGGGLVVLPHSHKLLFPFIGGKKDWCPLWDDRSFWNRYEDEVKNVPDLAPVRVGAPAGSLILFHSSVIHCNIPCQDKRPTSSHLQRAVVYVCMAPRTRIGTGASLTHWAAKRREAVDAGATTSHWPDRIEVKRPPRFALKRDLHNGQMVTKGTVLRYDHLTNEMKALL